MDLIYKVFFPSISTFETPPSGRPLSRATQEHPQLYLSTSVNLSAQELSMTLTFDSHDCERAQIGLWFGGLHTRGS